jgi:hypothetical protein
MSNNYDLKTLKAVKQLLDKNLMAKAYLQITQWVSEAELEEEKKYRNTDSTGESKAVPTNPDTFDYWRENDMN